jgi:hypothetical protein
MREIHDNTSLDNRGCWGTKAFGATGETSVTEENDRLAIDRLRQQADRRSQATENKSLNLAAAIREPAGSQVRIRGQGDMGETSYHQGTKVHEGVP